MLKRIPPILSPELMLTLMKMGHGDELVLADGNFPADRLARSIVRADGHGVLSLADAILTFLPLDTFVVAPAAVMRPVDGAAATPPIWTEIQRLIDRHEQRAVEIEQLERFTFYERAEAAFAIIATSETALYANLILKKGVVTAA